jgi:phosphoheptose isomerase
MKWNKVVAMTTYDRSLRFIRRYFEAERNIISKLDVEKIFDCIKILQQARDRASQIFVIGNGGSASTASHMVTDFNKGARTDGPSFRLYCLSDNIPSLTAIGNDLSYDDIFAYQLRGVYQRGDVLLAISGSGNSRNIIKAAKFVKNQGGEVVALVGFDGGKLLSLADSAVHIPSQDMQLVEDLHLSLNHVMMRCCLEML